MIDSRLQVQEAEREDRHRRGRDHEELADRIKR
jgi:hypothetical protein